MPHKIGHLYEKVITYENCLKAVYVGTQKLKRTDSVKRILENPEKYANKMLNILIEGWVPKPVRHKTINEGSSRKTRELTIPSTFDHLIHVAIMLPLIDELLKRYDDYSCGSIPGKGQKFAGQKMQSWIQGDYPYPYAAEADVHKFYASCKSEVVYDSLCRIIKDSRYLELHKLILQQMEGSIAIGFQPSHWYGNLVLTRVDNELRKQCGEVKFIRYMDNYVLVGREKEPLHKAIDVISSTLQTMDLELNPNWQVFPVDKRAVELLSYRYFPDKTILRKSTMYNMSARIKTAGKNNCAHLARGAVSRVGLLKHCDSYNYRKDWIDPYINIEYQRRMISDVDQKRAIREQTRKNRSDKNREQLSSDS